MENSPFIDGLPIKNGDFPIRYVSFTRGYLKFAALASTKTNIGNWFQILGSCGQRSCADLAADFLPDVPCMACHASYMGMDQYLLIPFLGGWTSIYQLFWCSPGVQGFDTLPYHDLSTNFVQFAYMTRRRETPSGCVFFFFRWVMHMPISLARLSLKYMTGWWFGPLVIFPSIGNNHLNWLIFFRGAETTNQMRYAQNYGRSCFFPLVFGKCTTHIVQRMGGPLQSDNLVSEFVEKLARDHR